jgi:hypothetical protein
MYLMNPYRFTVSACAYCLCRSLLSLTAVEPKWLAALYWPLVSAASGWPISVYGHAFNAHRNPGA